MLLGSAPDHRIQNDFVNLANQLHSSHGDRARLVLTYDEPLSHLVKEENSKAYLFVFGSFGLGIALSLFLFYSLDLRRG